MRKSVLFLLLFFLPIFAQTPWEVFKAFEGSELFGEAVGEADVNGDGIPDLIVGSPGENLAYLFYGGATMDTLPDKIFEGETSTDSFGYCLKGLGDLNQDGYEDFGVWSRAYASYTGRVYIYFGGADMDTLPDVIFTGENVADVFGWRFGAGDVDGNGYADLVITAPAAPSFALDGRIYVFFVDSVVSGTIFWGDTMVIYPDSAGEAIGLGLDLGDVNGDGACDIVAGGYGNTVSYPGLVKIYYGGALIDSVADVVMYGTTDGAVFGREICIGEVDGDGVNDLVVADQFGNVYVYYGGDPFNTDCDYTFSGSGDFGYDVEIGDVTGNGVPELVISYPSGDAVYAYLTHDNLDRYADLEFTSPNSGDHAGHAIAYLGDINEDGIGDVGVGTWSNPGYAYIVKGRDIDPPVFVTFTLPDSTPSFGPYVVKSVITDIFGIGWDTLYYDYGAGYTGVSHDSVVADTYYYTIPSFVDSTMILPLTLKYYLAAEDTNGNLGFDPSSGAASPYKCVILDTFPPYFESTATVSDTSAVGPFDVVTRVKDRYGYVKRVELWYIDSELETTYTIMFPTTDPDEYLGTIPVQYYPSRIIYWIVAYDGSDNFAYDPYDHPTPYVFHIGTPSEEIVLVNTSEDAELDTFYTKILDALGLVYVNWDMGSARYLIRNPAYKTVLWFTGTDTFPFLPEDIDSLKSFLNRGAGYNLFLSSQYLAEEIGNDTFMTEYLHAEVVGMVDTIIENAVAQRKLVYRDESGNVIDSIFIAGIFGGASNTESPDIVNPINGADTMYFYRWDTGGAVVRLPGAVRYGDETTYKVIYFPFPFEAIDGPPGYYTRQDVVMQRILEFFGYTFEGAPVVKKPVLAFMVKPVIFNDGTTFYISLPERMSLNVSIYNAMGRKVETVMKGEKKEGIYMVTWRPTVPPGIYYVRMEAGEKVITRKIMFMK